MALYTNIPVPKSVLTIPIAVHPSKVPFMSVKTLSQFRKAQQLYRQNLTLFNSMQQPLELHTEV
jgi:hypothetical protein